MMHACFRHDGYTFPCAEGERVTIIFKPFGACTFAQDITVSRDDLELWCWRHWPDPRTPDIIGYRRRVSDSFKLLSMIAADPNAVAIQ